MGDAEQKHHGPVQHPVVEAHEGVGLQAPGQRLVIITRIQQPLAHRALDHDAMRPRQALHGAQGDELVRLPRLQHRAAQVRQQLVAKPAAQATRAAPPRAVRVRVHERAGLAADHGAREAVHLGVVLQVVEKRVAQQAPRRRPRRGLVRQGGGHDVQARGRHGLPDRRGQASAKHLRQPVRVVRQTPDARPTLFARRPERAKDA
mmetsp:Transcript_65648/g.201164  ORF Transcript_65648/g.201164 Transcript_65648/m.201164 type:complete len:204 (-) Transcript_65648:566-1177(-)